MAAPAIGSSPEVEFKLSLFLDQSSSEYDNTSKVEGKDGRIPHWIVQRDAHIAAINHPAIKQDLIKHRVFVELVRWSDTTVVDFTGSITDEGAVNELTAAIQNFPDSMLGKGGTQHKLCQEHMLRNIHVGSFRQVADVSTDDGICCGQKVPIKKLREKLAKETFVEVNVISLNHENLTSDLRKYLQSPGGFTIGIDEYGQSSNNTQTITYDGYKKALQRKFMIELAWLTGQRRRM